jgi:hypothetical protein
LRCYRLGNRELLTLTAGIIAILGSFVSNAVNLLAEYARTRYSASFAHWLRVRLYARGKWRRNRMPISSSAIPLTC